VPAGQNGLTADALLAGPRGRSLCVNLLDDRLAPHGRRARRAWVNALNSVQTGRDERCASQLGDCVRIAGVSGVPFEGGALLAGLSAAVDFASYCQEPDAEDRGFARQAACEAMRPVAAAVVAAAARLADVHWWTEPVDAARQRCVQFLDETPLPEPALTGTTGLSRAWLADTRADELSARDGEDPDAACADQWWSSPEHSRLPVTTRELASLGAVGLSMAENWVAQQSARCWPVAVRNDARIYEISGPDQWVELVDRYPLDVSRSRRHDWRRATGLSGRWLIPDYAAVAADWSAIHLSVAGYLTTAGIALRADGGAGTVLAGWDPDATWWLNDVLSFTGPAEDWRVASHGPMRWARTMPGS
jgi:hypothetical protein